MGNVGEHRESTKGRATPDGIGLHEESGKATQRVRGSVSRVGRITMRGAPSKTVYPWKECERGGVACACPEFDPTPGD